MFDKNDPIVTNTWTNTIDRVNPTSRLTGVSSRTDSTATISLSGTDTESGIGLYRLYASEDNGNYNIVGNVSGDSILFTGKKGRRYSMYTVSVDSVGNTETKSPGAEISVSFSPNSVTGLTPQMIGLQVFPNPARNEVFVRASANLQTIEPLLRRSVRHEIDTDAPLDQIVADILRIAGLTA
ncbi:MAG: hypothetical protein EOO39_37425 [Cytophagaceae bacterium]|nr:MAG: hypothetical protein EOO39_37425 [Cytophagaceae bacterium]